jgi:hypothetical protein
MLPTSPSCLRGTSDSHASKGKQRSSSFGFYWHAARASSKTTASQLGNGLVLGGFAIDDCGLEPYLVRFFSDDGSFGGDNALPF